MTTTTASSATTAHRTRSHPGETRHISGGRARHFAPQRTDAIQGGLGDAWLIAVLGAVAGHRPDTIDKVLQHHATMTPDGQVAGFAHVRFHEARIDPATTDWTPTARRIMIEVSEELTLLPYAIHPPNTAYADTYHAGTHWPALLEKAFAAIDTTWTRRRRLTITDRGYTRLDQAASPYDIAEALTQLTGLRAGNLHLHPDTAATTLRYLLTQNRPVIITTREPNDPAARPINGAYPGHTYEITDIRPYDNTLRLHNPWGVMHIANLPLPTLFDLTGGIITTLKD